jgi:hypothetical protein
MKKPNLKINRFGAPATKSRATEESYQERFVVGKKK